MFNTIRSKLVAMLVGLGAGVVLIAGIGYAERQRAESSTDTLALRHFPAAVAIGRLSTSLREGEIWTQSAVADAQDHIDGALPVDRQHHDDALVELLRARADFEALPSLPGQESLWREVSSALADARTADDALWSALASADVSNLHQLASASERATQRAADACVQLLNGLASLTRDELEGARDSRGRADLVSVASLVAVLVLLAFAAARFIRGLETPIEALRVATDKLSRGEFDATFGVAGRDELGQLQESVRATLANLQAAADAATRMAEGDLDLHVVSRGPRDAMASAVNTLATSLRGIITQADAVASGDYTVNVSLRSARDLLGLAVSKMTSTLRDVGTAAERIAAGDLDVQLPSKGPNDRLSVAINRMTSTLKDAASQARVIADGNFSADIAPRSERDELGIALQRMTRALRDAARANRETDWLKSGVAAVNDMVLGQHDVRQLSTDGVALIARHIEAKVGAMYVVGAGETLELLGSYAYTERKHLATRFRLGEGLVGQAALERKPIVLTGVPDDYVRVTSGLGESAPRAVTVMPVLYRSDLRGVLEFGTLTVPSAAQVAYIEQAAAVLGVALEVARAQTTMQNQQEELRASNEELHQQTRALENASHELKAQQVELEQTNAELEVQMRRTQESEVRLKTQQKELEFANNVLEKRNVELERQKAEIESARRDLAQQAEELTMASKYKSEFLANMSHELRTPLNSLLLLARSLRDDTTGNLTSDQKESAAVIYSSGSDLLNLINEILDLSKIEAGRMELRMEHVDLAEVALGLTRQFDHMARAQGLELTVRVTPDAPARIVADATRLGQVLKNLVGNAVKFTEHGGVTVTFDRPTPEEARSVSRQAFAGELLARPALSPETAIAIRVADTGIGIARDKHRLVFEAFQQADSGDRRRYGGTGLGLSISRELATLMGGAIELQSEPGVGSTFTLIIPSTGAPREGLAPSRGPTEGVKSAAFPRPTPRAASTAPTPSASPKPAAPTAEPPMVADDRDTVTEHDRVILVIEDDARFARVLADEVRRRGLKCLVGLDGQSGLVLARSYRPSGVILDINLPDISGWTVLGNLKQDVDTRHIPVHIVSADEKSLDGLRIGAVGHVRKPLKPEDLDAILATIEKSSADAEKLVLVVEDDPAMRAETVRIIGNGTVHVHEVGTGTEALAALHSRRFDLMVLDLGLPDIQGIDLLRAACAERATLPPVIVHTTRDLTDDEELALRHYADSIIIKDVRSQERLVDEVALFLHRVVNDLPEDKRRTIKHLHDSDEGLRGKNVLIVEDDMRTMFAMAKLLASHGINPLKAANGEQALALLTSDSSVDVVLLDMMMPVMDGYETARHIRARDDLSHLPVIALTAKAMREDRQRCIEAGASDYLTKPVDPDRLVSLLRVWLSR